MQVLKLGTIVTDKVTDLDGMLTIMSYDMDKNINYLFQPAGLNPKTHEPLDTFWVTEKRIINAIKSTVELPFEILDTQVTDKATGYKGTVISLYYYINGCVHVEVKPKGVIEETGESIKAREFDIRRLKGDAIKELDEEELEVSKKKAPSPEARPSMDRR